MPKINRIPEEHKMISAGLLPAAQKFLSMQELKNNGLSQYKTRNLVKEGKLIKLNKSYYENTDYHGVESDFYYVSAYAPKGVVCLLSAAIYYHLTAFIPDAADVAIPRKAKISTIPDWPPMKIHYYTDDRYKLGVLTVREDKNEFRIYDVEKTVVDIVFYREKVGIEETKEILLTYLQRKERPCHQAKYVKFAYFYTAHPA